MSDESRTASPDQDFLKLLDALQAAQRNYDDLTSLRFGLNPASDSSLDAAHNRLRAARQSLVDYVAKRHQCYVEVLEEYKASESELAALTEDRDAVRSQVKWLHSENERHRLECERLRRFETYVCQVIAMGNQADLTVESLPR